MPNGWLMNLGTLDYRTQYWLERLALGLRTFRHIDLLAASFLHTDSRNLDVILADVFG